MDARDQDPVDLPVTAVPVEVVLFRTGEIQNVRKVIGVGLVFW